MIAHGKEIKVFAGNSNKHLAQGICNVLGLSADYVLFGAERTEDAMRTDAIHRIHPKYISLLDKLIAELLAISELE